MSDFYDNKGMKHRSEIDANSANRRYLSEERDHRANVERNQERMLEEQRAANERAEEYAAEQNALARVAAEEALKSRKATEAKIQFDKDVSFLSVGTADDKFKYFIKSNDRFQSTAAAIDFASPSLLEAKGNLLARLKDLREAEEALTTAERTIALLETDVMYLRKFGWEKLSWRQTLTNALDKDEDAYRKSAVEIVTPEEEQAAIRRSIIATHALFPLASIIGFLIGWVALYMIGGIFLYFINKDLIDGWVSVSTGITILAWVASPFLMYAHNRNQATSEENRERLENMMYGNYEAAIARARSLTDQIPKLRAEIGSLQARVAVLVSELIGARQFMQAAVTRFGDLFIEYLDQFPANCRVSEAEARRAAEAVTADVTLTAIRNFVRTEFIRSCA